MMRVVGLNSQPIDQVVVLVNGQAHVSDDLPDEGANQRLATVIGDDHGTAIGSYEGVVAPTVAPPVKTGEFRDPRKIPVSYQL